MKRRLYARPAVGPPASAPRASTRGDLTPRVGGPVARGLAVRGPWVAGLALLALSLGAVLSAPPAAQVLAADGDGAAPRIAEPGPQERAMIELGRRLFFDPVVSRSGERSCASCHDPEHGFSDPERVSQDDVGSTVRHSQTLLHSHLNPSAHWDGEFASIEQLVTARIGLTSSERGYGATSRTSLTPGHSSLQAPDEELVGRDELGRVITRARGDGHADPSAREPLGGRLLTNQDLDRLPRAQDVIEQEGRYDEAVKAAFGDTSVSRARIARAIAAYCRSLVSTPAPIDRYLSGQRDALSPAAQRGLALFRGKAGCASCHQMSAQHPVFTDYEFHNTGVAFRGFQERMGSVGESHDRAIVDPGRFRISTVQSQLRGFKTPTLRDVARRGPYMHDGSLASLEQVVRFYGAGAGGDEDQDPRLARIQLSDVQVADIVAFLHSLTGAERPGLAPAGYRARAAEMALRFVDQREKPMAGMEVRLVAAGDRVPGPGARVPQELRRVTDEHGWIAAAPPPTTHWQIVLPEGLLPRGGAMVPDTSARATAVVPVSGRVSITLVWPVGSEPPPTLVTEHAGTLVLPGHLPPRTLFSLKAQLPSADTVVLRYEGWLRTDVPTKVEVRVPGAARSESLDLAKPDRLRIDAR